MNSVLGLKVDLPVVNLEDSQTSLLGDFSLFILRGVGMLKQFQGYKSYRSLFLDSFFHFKFYRYNSLQILCGRHLKGMQQNIQPYQTEPNFGTEQTSNAVTLTTTRIQIRPTPRCLKSQSFICSVAALGRIPLLEGLFFGAGFQAYLLSCSYLYCMSRVGVAR